MCGGDGTSTIGEWDQEQPVCTGKNDHCFVYAPFVENQMILSGFETFPKHMLESSPLYEYLLWINIP